MELTQDMISYCEKQPWDDDVRQEVYLKVLEAPEATINDAWLSRVYTNLMHNTRRDERRRAELREENVDVIAQALGLSGTAADPLDTILASEEIRDKLKLLSPLLLQTLIRVFIDNMMPEELAEWEGTTANVIYQRIHQARKVIEGEEDE